MKKRIVFLTGTRADFGKLKSLIKISINSGLFDVDIFATGMHLQQKYGLTVREIEKSGFSSIYSYINSTSEKSMDLTLAKTIEGLSNFVKEFPPDLIVVHGDRVEALAGAIVGSLNNILVSHIEGGEVSGTIDELIRHSVSKISHTHFVSNQSAKDRLLQMGETANSIFVIGSPDVDVMMANDLPSIEKVRKYYDIEFQRYCILMFHPVTTEDAYIEDYASQLVQAVIESGRNYVVIYPNNDLGSQKILKAYEKFNGRENFKIFPSIRFEYFLVLLKNSDLIIGNSSAGIREAPYYGVPTINVGTRQLDRSDNPFISHSSYEIQDILDALRNVTTEKMPIESSFGDGRSDVLFLKTLEDLTFWKINKQKRFVDFSKPSFEKESVNY